MRSDLGRYIPAILLTNKLACCVCGRWLKYDDFSLEHIIPQQSLDDDPEIVKKNVFRSVRSGVTLLCNKPILINGKRASNHGCNSYKGRFIDKRLREVFNRSMMLTSKMHSGHQVALFCVAYLAMFSHYGYYVTLIKSGLLCRKQFFSPDRFLDIVPPENQMILMGEKPTVYNDDLSIWEKPFIFRYDSLKCFVTMRGLLVLMPMSRDPSIPVSSVLPYASPRFKLRPDFRAFFD